MRVVVAPDRFGNTLTAAEAAEAIARGWSRSAPHDELVLVPLSDGGSGFVDVLATALAGDVLAATVSGPLGRPVPAAVLVAERDGRRTAYLDAAQACGPDLLGPGEDDPAVTTSTGVGELLEVALRTRPSRIVVGTGAVATHDGGAGLLAALGVGDRQRLGRGGLALADLTAGDLAGLEAGVARFRDVELLLATRDELPLLGFQGSSAVLAQSRGVTPEQGQALERALGQLVGVVRQVHPGRLDLLTGSTRRAEREPGAGAGGGLGYALLLLGGRRVSGVGLVADALGLRASVCGADLVVTGEQTFGRHSLHGSVVAGVAEVALGCGVPAVVLADRVQVGRREAMAAGLSGAYAVHERTGAQNAPVPGRSAALAARAAQVAATWSPARGTAT